MEPISRRMFLAGSVAVVVAACSDGDGTASTTAEPAPSGSPAATDAEPTTGEQPPQSTTTAEPAPTTTGPAIDLPTNPFTLGIASGDPTPTSVVLWTRLAPEPLAVGGGMPDADVTVGWEVATDADFREVVTAATAPAEARFGHSVHVTVEVPLDDPLAPLVAGRSLYYRFAIGEHRSPVGITRFAPAPDAAVDQARFASASCQHYEAGFYVAHRDLAAQRLDFVVWLGDYIYEGGQGVVGENDVVRTHGTPEVTSLDDYRARYALYKTDADLQAAHAVCPWVVTWDDHEVENNYAGLVPQDESDVVAFAQRRHDAYQAWWEHQPVALPPPVLGEDFPIYRSFQWGSLLTVAVLDGRQYRSDQTCGGATLNLDPACPETFDESRSMLGDVQEAWLFDVLGASTTTWNVIAQQTVFGDVTIGAAVLNYDQWDGYPVQRNRIVDRLAADAIDNVVVLTGDIHFAGAGTIRAGGRGTGVPVGTEFVATSVSSGGRVDPAVTDVVRAIPDIIDVELEHRGYIVHTVGAPAWDAQYRMIDTVKQPESSVYQHAVYRVDAGTNLVHLAEGLRRD